MRVSTLYTVILLLGLLCYVSAPVSAAPGDLDTTFNPDAGITAAWTVATQSDGKVLVGCSFDAQSPATHGRVCRLNTDGTLDTTFFNNTGSGTDGKINTIAVQFDGKILFGGTFSVVNGVSRPGLARLNGDGTLDSTFQPVVGGPVNAIVVQPNGKIVIGGLFSHVNNQFLKGVARLKYDGSVDTSFADVGSGGCPSFFSVLALALQPDEKIIGGGLFMMLNGALCKNMARVYFNSFHDTAFDNNLGTGATNIPNTNDRVLALAVASGKIYVGGNFTKFNNATRFGLARLNSNGTLDNAFAPGLAVLTVVSSTPTVNALVIQSNGDILIGGSFHQIDGLQSNNLARLKIDGTLDQTFLNSGVGPNASVTAIAVQPDGKILIAGSFTQFSGVPRPGIARVLGDAGPPPSPPPTGPPVLLTEGNTTRAIAPDSVTLVRDPVPVLTSHNLSADRHTRVTLFANNVELIPGEGAVVTAQAEDSQQRVFPLTVEFAGKVPGVDGLTQITVRLTDELENAGDIRVSVRVRGVQSNTVLIKVGPSP
ncbi:MAG TPA: hypothetical protein VF290_21565 [Pyrinomonadaceae bacterium]